MNKDSFGRSLLLVIVPRLFWLVTRAWYATLRVRFHGLEHRQATLDSGRPTILTCWHYSLLLLFQVLRRYRGVVMVSSSRDGDYIASYAEYCGLTTVRGSRNRQGLQALKELLRCGQAGRSIGLIADGSQGPPRVAQPGSILLSSRSGSAILPVAWSASKYFAVRSWDRTAFPWPFARVEVLFGEPLAVPPELDGEGIERCRLELEHRLNLLYGQAWAMTGRDGH